MEEPDTPSVDVGSVNEGGNEAKEVGGASSKSRQFNQVMLQAQNKMILMAVLLDQRDKVTHYIALCHIQALTMYI